MSVVSSLTNVVPQYLHRVNPSPEYISHTSACQAVNEFSSARRGRLSDDEDISVSDSGDRVNVAENAVALVNAFLDKLLYDFLATARSTSLLVLKPAVADVLKKSLGREAIASAEENLEDLLALQDEDDEPPRTPSRDGQRWNLEFVWKRTRLRVMMRSEKSEFDIDDDERYVHEEGLQSPGRRFSQSASVISLSAEIFLAGVLDYVAESLLDMAQDPATKRARRHSRTTRVSPGVPAPLSVVIEENDIEKAVLNSPLDRLWRTWRKSLRARNGIARTSRGTLSGYDSPIITRRGSVIPTEGSVISEEGTSEQPQSTPHRPASDVPEPRYPEHILASNIPLPVGNRDVDEIEVPGLATDPDGEDSGAAPPPQVPRRRSSLNLYSSKVLYGGAQGNEDTDEDEEMTGLHHTRSRSVPTPALLPYAPPTGEVDYAPAAEANSEELQDADKEVYDEKYHAGDLTNLKDEARRRSLLTLNAPGAFPITPAVELANPADYSDDEDGVNAEQDSAESDPPSVSATTHIPNAITTEGSVTRPASSKRVSMRPLVPERSPRRGVSPAGSAISENAASKPTTAGASAQDDHTSRQGIFGGVAVGGIASAAVAAALAAAGRSGAEKKETPSATSAVDEEVDKRKSLVDMKDLVSSQNGSQEVVGSRDGSRHEGSQITSGVLSVPPRNASPASDASGHSDRTYTLNRSGHAVLHEDKALPQHMGGVESPERSRAEATPSSSPLQRVASSEGQYARNAQRSNRPVLTTPISARSNSFQNGSQNTPKSPTSPRDFLASRKLSGSVVERSTPSPPQDRAYTPSTPTVDTAVTQPSPRRSPLQRRDTPPMTAQAESPVEGFGRSSPLAQQLVKARQLQKDGAMERKGSSSSSSERRGSLRLVGVESGPLLTKQNSLKSKFNKSNQQQPLTSASITSPEDFDLFVQGQDTVKYTLTPEKVRDSPVSCRVVSSCTSGATDMIKASNREQWTYLDPRRSSNDSNKDPMQGGPVKRPSPPPPLDTSVGEADRSGRSQVASTATAAGPTEKEKAEAAAKERRRSISRPPPTNTTTSPSGLMAREPRIQTESTRDFADFIRSTGPGKEQNIAIPGLANRSTTSLRSLRSQDGTPRAQSPGGARSEDAFTVGKADMEAENIPPIPSMPQPKGKGRPNMQPRGATNSSGGGNAELIDFIRNGPPTQNGEHRIPRSVAPFRSTMDSDDLQSLGDKVGDRIGSNKQLDLSLKPVVPPSALPSSSRGTSARTSTNSRTGLLPGSTNTTRNVQPAYSSQPPRLTPSLHAPNPVAVSNRMNPPEPQRKRHRNKDPYPIDSDSDDDILTALPAQRNKPQESLIDFLRNNEPPAANSPAPLAGGGPGQARALMARARVATANNLSNSLRDTNNSGPVNGQPSGSTATAPAADAAPARGLNRIPTLNPSQLTSSSNPDDTRDSSYDPSITSSTATTRPAYITAQISSAGSVPQVRHKVKMESRSAGEKSNRRLGAFHTDTGDLADFLRSSGPVGGGPATAAGGGGAREGEVGGGAPAPVVGKGPKLEKKKGAKFWRRKTYLDMP